MNKPFFSITSDKPVGSHICAYMAGDNIRISVDARMEDIIQLYQYLVESLKKEIGEDMGVDGAKGLLTFLTVYALGDTEDREKLSAQARAMGIEDNDCEKEEKI